MRARILFSDGTWASFARRGLTERHARILPSTNVPPDICLALQAVLHSLPPQHPDFPSWTPSTWANLHLSLPPSPASPPFSPPTSLVPVTPTIPLSSSPSLFSPQGIVTTLTNLLPQSLRRRRPIINDEDSSYHDRDSQPPSQRPRLEFPHPVHGNLGSDYDNPAFQASVGRTLHTPGLRIATHNVSGLTSAAAVFSLVQAWSKAHLDIICLQETWVGRPSGHSESTVTLWLRQATDSLHFPPFDIFWAHNTRHPDQNNGVAILIRPSPHVNATAHLPNENGRLQSIFIRWAGHSFSLFNSYWPSTGPSDRATFLHSILTPALAECAHPSCLVGDFNFTPQPELDRRPLSHTTMTSDMHSATLLSSTLPHHLDVYRHRHPTGKAFSFHRPNQCARLDRLYLPADICASVRSASIVFCPHGDHHAVAIHLLPATPLQPRGRGRRRLPHSLPSCSSSLSSWSQRAVAYGLSLSHADLLRWWPTLQQCLITYTRSLHSHDRRCRAATTRPLQGAQDALHTAMQALSHATPANLSNALLAAASAHNSYRDLHINAAQHQASSARHAWLHAHERPSRLLTSLLSPPVSSSAIASLAHEDGSLLFDNTAIANRLNAYYAAISGPRTTDPAAQEAILAALQTEIERGSVHTILPAQGLAAGAAEVTHEEVVYALQRTNPTSSPGHDGIPYSLWRIDNYCWAPLLAHLFTAVGTLGLLPPGFNKGTITPIPKQGATNTSAPPSYRPITLLPCLYRLLGKILAYRFGIALAPALGPEHAAFLPGRRIEDNINFTSLLPPALHAAGVTAATFFLDISKAFDTIDRPFLYRLMTTLGASSGMINWARLLLHNTVASTHANGVESLIQHWHAGVRQGCPLSPLLYLFVAQSLASWLRAQPNIGVTIDGHRFVSSHYADDTQIHQADLSPATLATIAPLLNTFATATGQAINLSKSCALLSGPLHPLPIPTSLAGIPVVPHTTSLGIPQSNPTTPMLPHTHPYPTRASLRPLPSGPLPSPPPYTHAAWQTRRDIAVERLRRIERLPLSTMGRGLAASAYALSTFLYHAEFAGTPSFVHDMIVTTASAVGRGISPP
ncbi:MAG: hypothetical protein EOM68_15140, partial [Spirochaetia bacterium]|nr:hypothetical protein [Spirochaetia bacterium]